eukprot:3535749-Rhodomonas_salina.1
MIGRRVRIRRPKGRTCVETVAVDAVRDQVNFGSRGLHTPRAPLPRPHVPRLTQSAGTKRTSMTVGGR